MKKTFTPFRKLRALALLSSLLFASSMLQAQVVYTDVNPDDTETQTSDGFSLYNIDLNNDAQVDFIISIVKVTDEPTEDGLATVTATTIDISQYDAANVVGIAVDNLSDENAISFSNAATIGSSETWDSEYGGLSSVGSYTPLATGTPIPVSLGNFINSTGKYIGVQIEVAGETYYGYIAINTTSNSFTVTGYAYEQTPDVSIAAGATTTGVSSYLKSNTSIYTVNNTVVADFKNAFTGQMDVVNMNGVVVKSVSVNGTSASVSMDAAQSGAYQVILSGADGFASEKVVIVNK